VGFSQGANVVHNFSADLTAAQARRVAVVAMIADPVKNPADSIRTWSYSTKTPGPGKFGAGALMGKHVRDKAITFCVAKDEICNRPADGGPASPSSTHRHFYERATSARSAGRQLDAMLRRSGVG
ncbi:cutinase family protein, partial [Aeromicrobium sp.]|uniref:cutinase family protein n=1 Tax=Aeromicrobium sp. TaxID=1871063 RepID=UPI001988B8C8